MKLNKIQSVYVIYNPELNITKYRRIGKNKYKDKDGNIKYIAYINGKLCEVEAV
jgi:hypothetical protein